MKGKHKMLPSFQQKLGSFLALFWVSEWIQGVSELINFLGNSLRPTAQMLPYTQSGFSTCMYLLSSVIYIYNKNTANMEIVLYGIQYCYCSSSMDIMQEQQNMLEWKQHQRLQTIVFTWTNRITWNWCCCRFFLGQYNSYVFQCTPNETIEKANILRSLSLPPKPFPCP